jgi:hypothetical protein
MGSRMAQIASSSSATGLMSIELRLPPMRLAQS